MTEDEKAALWRCAVCGTSYVVTSMARLCEAKHREGL